MRTRRRRREVGETRIATRTEGNKHDEVRRKERKVSRERLNKGSSNISVMRKGS